MSKKVDEIRDTLERLLTAIQNADLETYKTLVRADLTCFEPETRGHRVNGLDFHFFVTQSQAELKRLHLEIIDPVIRVFGNTGYAAYTLHVMREDANGFHIATMNETRVFVKQGESWKMAHFHRSLP